MAGLNPSQQAAVDHREGPLLVLAGAGSGKTRVITRRIADIVGEGVAPSAILAVSFTNKAADEMRERMVPLIGSARANKLVLSTFHSFGVRFIHEESETMGLGDRFVIFDQGDATGVIKEVLRGLRESGAARRLDPAAIVARISKWKNELIGPDEVPESDFEYDDVAREVYPDYVARMRAMRALDFDDLVVAPVRLLREREDVREKWRKKFRYLLIDEFQDTSRVQLELVKQLTNERGNVCVVGDDDQSIYGWRGADVGNILGFDKHFPGTRIVKLEDNYRSKEPIIAVANAAISQSKGERHGKLLRSARGAGEPVRLCTSEDPAAEAKMVAREIEDLVKGGQQLSEVAVLYRSNLQARLIEEELRLAGIAYRLFGGQQFFDRKEVKDVAAYLRAVLNPRDDISMRRIVNYPARGIGATSVERVDQYALAHTLSFADALLQVEKISNVPENARKSIHEFNRILDETRRAVDSGQKLRDVAERLITRIDIRKDLMDAAEGGKMGASRCGNLDHFTGWISRFEEKSGSDRKSLQKFLERVTLRGDAKEEDTNEAVVLSSLHAAKGLEFEVVFLIGCVEGQLPHSRTTDPKASEASPTDVDEERRLFYVGVTRARDRLYLSRPLKRLLRGKGTDLIPSRFLEGLPEEHTQAYSRKDLAPLDHDEIAQLGRDFLNKMAAKGIRPPNP